MFWGYRKRQTLKVCLFCLAGIVGDGQFIWNFLLCLCRAKKRRATSMFSRKWTRGNFLCPKTMTFCPKTSGAKVGSSGAWEQRSGAREHLAPQGAIMLHLAPPLGAKKVSKVLLTLVHFTPSMLLRSQLLNAVFSRTLSHGCRELLKLCIPPTLPREIFS